MGECITLKQCISPMSNIFGIAATDRFIYVGQQDGITVLDTEVLPAQDRLDSTIFIGDAKCTDLVFYDSNRLLVLDSHQGSIYVVKMGDQTSDKLNLNFNNLTPNSLSSPEGFCLAPASEDYEKILFVSDTGNSRILRITLDIDANTGDVFLEHQFKSNDQTPVSFPLKLAATDDKIYFTSTINDRNIPSPAESSVLVPTVEGFPMDLFSPLSNLVMSEMDDVGLYFEDIFQEISQPYNITNLDSYELIPQVSQYYELCMNSDTRDTQDEIKPGDICSINLKENSFQKISSAAQMPENILYGVFNCNDSIAVIGYAIVRVTEVKLEELNDGGDFLVALNPCVSLLGEVIPEEKRENYPIVLGKYIKIVKTVYFSAGDSRQTMGYDENAFYAVVQLGNKSPQSESKESRKVEWETSQLSQKEEVTVRIRGFNQSFCIDENTTVGQLKTLIYDDHGIPVLQQFICNDFRQLADEEIVREIKTESNIFLVINDNQENATNRSSHTLANLAKANYFIWCKNSEHKPLNGDASPHQLQKLKIKTECTSCNHSEVVNYIIAFTMLIQAENPHLECHRCKKNTEHKLTTICAGTQRNGEPCDRIVGAKYLIPNSISHSNDKIQLRYFECNCPFTKIGNHFEQNKITQTDDNIPFHLALECDCEAKGTIYPPSLRALGTIFYETFKTMIPPNLLPS